MRLSRLADVLLDLRLAIRSLSCQPVLVITSVLLLALGVGLVTSLLSFLNAEVFRPWQVADPGSVALIRARPTGQDAVGTISVAEYRYLRDSSLSISRMVAIAYGRDSHIDDGSGHQIDAATAFVNSDYFPALQVGMAAGRGFDPDDDNYSAPTSAVVMSERLWRLHFSSDPHIVGTTLHVGKEFLRLVGVAERGFSDPASGSGRIDLWRPLPSLALIGGAFNLARFADPRGPALNVLAARLRPGVARVSAETELSILSSQFRHSASLASSGLLLLDTRPISRWGGFLPGAFALYLILFLAVSLVLVVACANVGALLLARALARQRELAIRVSLGATRLRLATQLSMDAAVLSVAAGILGLALAFAIPWLLRAWGFRFTPLGFARITSSSDSFRPEFYAPDRRVFLLAVLVVGVTTLLVGIWSMLRVTGVASSHLVRGRHGHAPTATRLRLVLLAGQIALTTLLLSGASLLTRAIGHASSLNAGFATEGVQAISLQLGLPRGPDNTRWKAFFAELQEALRHTSLWPVAFSEQVPLSSLNYVMVAHRLGDQSGVFHSILLRPVSSNYFAVLGIPIVAGRVPSTDTDASEIVVSEAAAHILWPGVDPIGKTLQSAITESTFESCQVVGVARDVPIRSMSEIEPVIYRAPSWTSATLLVRGAAPDAVEQVRAVAMRLDPHVTVASRPLVDYVRDAMGMSVIAARVAWAIGVLALALAATGISAMFAHAVESRRSEIALRMALGATSARVVLLVLLSAKSALTWGLAAGFAFTLTLVPLLRHFLYGLSPLDPVSYLQVAAVVAVSAGLATWIPARRATAIDPADALRWA